MEPELPVDVTKNPGDVTGPLADGLYRRERCLLFHVETTILFQEHLSTCMNRYAGDQMDHYFAELITFRRSRMQLSFKLGLRRECDLDCCSRKCQGRLQSAGNYAL